jgi:hypothetical protein
MRLFFGIVLAVFFFTNMLSVTLLEYEWPPPCRFSRNFTREELLTSAERRDAFLKAVMYWEGHFHTPYVSYNPHCGLTYDGTEIDYTQGTPREPLHFWSAPSKESLHVALLALAIAGNKYAQIFVSPDNPSESRHLAIDLLTKKISSLERWNLQFPGYGGYIPWVYVNDKGMTPANGWTNAVPALDNGELIWSLFATYHILKRNATTHDVETLAMRYKRQLDLMAKTAKMIFYDGGGRVRAVTHITNTSAAPFPGNYKLQDCSENCYLDDPYEGELFTFFLDLYGQWENDTERELLWMNKRNKLQSVDYSTPFGSITVQRGWWFSSHEQWKYLEMPYFDIPINYAIFMNGERARTWNSVLKSIPGLFASVTGVSHNNSEMPVYLSAVGIQEIAFERVLYQDVVTPYATFPVMLANLSVGLVWYNELLKAPKMQGPLGSTEAINVNGTMISPVVTWDSKITTILAMLGGISQYVREGLIKEGRYDRFYSIVDREWRRAFPTIRGTTLLLILPNATIVSDRLSDFTLCR